VSFLVRSYRILRGENEPLSAEIQAEMKPAPTYGEGI
jgi:hypothetical protein